MSKEFFDAEPKRALVKAITYRVFGTAMSTLIAWLISHSVRVSLGVLAFDSVGKTALYYVHERVWNHIGWGRRGRILDEPVSD